MSFELQPHLRGATLSLRPLRADDLEPLWTASSDPLIWALHPDKSRGERAGFERFFAISLASGGALAVVANDTGAVIGSSRYYEWDPGARAVAIGYTFLTRDYWGGAANREMKRLMIEHAFNWADVIWFHVGASNLRSRRAMEKLGARLSHTGQRPLNDQPIDCIYYCIDRQDWKR
jgi:RimJ/RimL family protein N-acetyltransferase